MFNKKKEAVKQSNKWIFAITLAAGIASLGASFVLTLDKLKVLQDPDAILSCSINIVLNCSTVMQTWQSSLFGFPNMIIGLMAFPLVIMIAVLGLWGAKLPRKFLIAANIGILLGLIFSYWLFFQSLYVIQVLCPWCLLVTLSMTLILSSMTFYNLRENTYGLKGKLEARVKLFIQNGYYQLVVAAWIVLLVALVFIKFGDALFA